MDTLLMATAIFWGAALISNAYLSPEDAEVLLLVAAFCAAYDFIYLMKWWGK